MDKGFQGIVIGGILCWHLDFTGNKGEALPCNLLARFPGNAPGKCSVKDRL